MAANATNNGHSDFMDKETLRHTKPKFKPVTIDGYEAPFLMRRLSGKDRIDYLESSRAIPENDLKAFRGLRDWAVARAWINRDGTRVLDVDEPADMALLAEMDNEDIETLFAAAFNISKEVLEATAAEAAEQLGNAPSASSPIASLPAPAGEPT